MFGKLGKQYAAQVGDAIEGLVNTKLNTGDNSSAANRATEKPEEVLTNINGKRKALFIGINYFGTKCELKGCINDVRNIKTFLEEQYKIDEVMVLTDDQTSDKCKMPTRDNILNGFKWLKQGSKSGDSLIMHYSGHGGSVKDLNGDEEDGFDETLCPVDYASAGQILDDEVHEILVKGIPKGVRLTAIMDCCHSHSILDLPFTYNINGDLEIIMNDKNKGVSKILASGVKYALGDKTDGLRGIQEGFKMFLTGSQGGGNSEARAKTVSTRTTEADVIMFSGCQDSQTSADACIGGEATGAMSYALIRALRENQHMDYTQLLRRMREILTEQYSQVPMMSAGRKLKLDSAFTL
jgi:metacaspase-1